MNALEEFDYVTEKLKSARFCGFKGYRVDKILTIPTQEVLKGVFRMSNHQLYKSLLGDILIDGYHYDFESIRNAKIVLFYSLGHAMRADYVHFMETVASCSDDTVLFTGSCNNGRLISKIKVRLSSIKMFFLLLLWIVTLSKARIDKKYWKKYLCSLLSGYKWKSILIKNEDVILSIKSMVSIFDAREYENIFTQFLNLHGIPTATLQHGHYGKEFFKDQKNFYIGIGYRGFVSDYFLAWGDFSCNNALSCEIPMSKLIKVGSPSLINTKKIEGRKGTVGLLLDGGEEAIPDNRNMYYIIREIAKEKGKKLLVKQHPSFKTPEYSFFVGDENVELYSGDLESFATEVELAICCNTSCLITLLIWGLPIIHYAPLSMYDMFSELKNYSFTNKQELNDLYDKNVSPTSLLSLYTEVDHVKENYRNAFEQIIMNKSE